MANKPLSTRAAEAKIEDTPALLEELYEKLFFHPLFDWKDQGILEVQNFGEQFQHHLRYPSGYIAAALMLVDEGLFIGFTTNGYGGFDAWVKEAGDFDTVTAVSPALALISAIAESKGC